eukprot:m.608251 g.608251  ORF g.608251 m.608251 type:complete len:53 (-) comp22484_c2_seq18:2732-2890(-)
MQTHIGEHDAMWWQFATSSESTGNEVNQENRSGAAGKGIQGRNTRTKTELQE